MASGAHYAGLLRHELRARNLEFARKHKVAHQLSYGDAPVVCYEPDGPAHGNFLPETYAAIMANVSWSKRLKKVHTSGRTSLPHNDRGFWAELDSCNSSDALLMNVFCYPGVTKDTRVLSLLGMDELAEPEYGVRARVPLLDDKFDRTEIDMRLESLLVEAKLTEGDFQSREKKFVDLYRDFKDVFNRRELPQTRERYLSYQLIRNVLAAYALDCAFCVLHDGRRPDLRDAWYDVMRCVKLHELRLRCKVLTWQELAAALPERLQGFLEEKYGISPHL